MVSGCDVVVVGAGLAGLVCAGTLQRRGFDVDLLEAGDDVGGRVRTDEIDGYRCDRGFQLLNPAYPAVRRLVDVDALDLKSFAPGVAVRRGDDVAVLADPRRAPKLLPATLRSGLVGPRQLAPLTRWLAPALGPVSRLLRSEDTTLTESLDRAGVHGPVREEVLERFLAGVLADDTGTTSAIQVRLFLRSFLLGTPGLPAEGMAALPRQLAGRLRRPAECGVRVREVLASGGVRTDDGDRPARAVVVATDPVTAGELTDAGAPTMRGLTTWWFSTTDPVPSGRLLRVDGAGGPVVNTAVVSAVAPSYAPAGRQLVQLTTLLPAAVDEAGIRAEAARLWGTPTEGWDLVVRHDVPHALPAKEPPLQRRLPVDLGGGVFVAGDHRDTASIQGALVSGRRTARAVQAWLHTQA